MINRDDIAALIKARDALAYAIRFARPEDMDRDYLKEQLTAINEVLS
jgi:hypothetical protein